MANGMEDMTGVMNPAHPRWPDYIVRLSKALDAWGCSGTDDFLRYSQQILTGWDGVELEKSIRWLMGYAESLCDCGVVWTAKHSGDFPALCEPLVVEDSRSARIVEG